LGVRIFLLCLALVACNGKHGLGDGGALDDGSGGAGGSAGSSGGAGGGSGGSGGGTGGSGGSQPDGGCPPPTSGPPNCWPICTQAATCASPVGGAYSADNYSCDQNVCRYLGCFTDQECQQTFGQTGKTYRCVSFPCTSLRFCQQACTQAAECASETTPGGAFGADNYACDQGICKYTGCTSTAECQVTFGTTRPYICANGMCQLRCNSPADCALPSGGAYAADRYQCTGNLCVWLGCNSDSSCQQTFQSPNYACR
jgi:hypothetical protein